VIDKPGKRALQQALHALLEAAGVRNREGRCPRVHDIRHNSGNPIIPATDGQQAYFLQNRGVAGTLLAE
jgi:hypothetical protein